MLQFYVVDDLQQNELNITHFEKLREAVRAYADLPATNRKALGVQDGGEAVDLIQCLPVRPRDQDGEDVMVLEILEHPMWKSRPRLLVTAQDLAARFMVRYCLFQGCLLPIPTRDTLPRSLRNRFLWPDQPGDFRTAAQWIYVAGAGRLSAAEFKRRYSASRADFSYPLVTHISAFGVDKRGNYHSLQVSPWEFHLLAKHSQERLDQNKHIKGEDSK